MISYAIVCACGRRVEAEGVAYLPFTYLREGDHDPDECSRQIVYQGRIDGRLEMVDVTIEHLIARRTLNPGGLAEIHTVLLDRARSLR